MNRYIPLGLATILFAGGQVHAGERCTWPEGTQPTSMTRILPGVMHVPLNATPGDVIGTPNQWHFTASSPWSTMQCYNDGDVLWRYDTIANSVFPDPLPPVAGEPSDGYILNTNVDGVGARIRLKQPFNGSDPNYFMPEGGPHDPFIPFRSTFQNQNHLGGFTLGAMWNEVTLVKTGDIAPGMHNVDAELYTGHLSAKGLGLVTRYRLQATVLQTQCSLIGDPVDANPVDLQDWDKSNFVARGTTTAIIPFSITLSNCQTDPGGLTRASIELVPADGSRPVSGLDGVFTLTPDSTAEGVGIQVLKDDGSPLPLQREEDLKAIQDGTTVLNFGARFYQTDDASAVRAGEANGALSFTIRYR